MQILGVSLMTATACLCFSGIIYWALVLQPKAEARMAETAAPSIWDVSSLQKFGRPPYVTYQLLPSTALKRTEYLIRNEELGREIGRYLGGGRKSASIEYEGKTLSLYIQGALLGRSVNAGQVGGTSNNSIVIRDTDHVIAEIWRTQILPSLAYRCDYAGETFEVESNVIWPTRPGRITKTGKEVGAFRRPALASRNIFVALDRELPEELKICLCSICLLQ